MMRTIRVLTTAGGAGHTGRCTSGRCGQRIVFNPPIMNHGSIKCCSLALTDCDFIGSKCNRESWCGGDTEASGNNAAVVIFDIIGMRGRRYRCRQGVFVIIITLIPINTVLIRRRATRGCNHNSAHWGVISTERTCRCLGCRKC